LKAARFYEVGQPLRIEDVEKPAISPKEVLVRINDGLDLVRRGEAIRAVVMS